MIPLGLIHTGAGLLALASGSAILAIAQGTKTHRVIGYVYVISMLVLNATALMIYRVFGTFGPFHVLALISLISLALGFLPVYLKRPRDQWVFRHYEGMSWSYVGLLAATAAEIAVRLPWVQGFGLGFGVAVFVTSSLVVFCGALILNRNRDRVVSHVLKNLKPSGRINLPPEATRTK